MEKNFQFGGRVLGREKKRKKKKKKKKASLSVLPQRIQRRTHIIYTTYIYIYA
jgi:hypothetical protein